MKFNLLILILLLCFTAYADISGEIIRSDKSLIKIREILKQEQKEVHKLSDVKKKKAKELMQAELEVKYSVRLADKLQLRLSSLQKNISFINFRQKKLTDRQVHLRENIRSANCYLAGAGETELLEALILSDELKELTAGLQIISRVNSRLFDMVKELSENKERLEKNREKLLETKEELQETLKEKNAALKELRAKKVRRKQLYKLASEDEKIQQEYISMLHKKQSEIEKKIRELQMKQQRQGELNRFDGLHKDFAGMKGKFMWPINGKVIEHFGTKRVKGFRGVIHVKGIKIEPDETQVASVYDGVVMHTDTAWGLGNFVIVEHYGGYYTLYANMDEITVRKGQKVHTGEVLGRIDIDRPANTPYLYFEIRIHDKAVNPLKWLRS